LRVRVRLCLIDWANPMAIAGSRCSVSYLLSLDRQIQRLVLAYGDLESRSEQVWILANLSRSVDAM
jgi:hypothetical protein